MIGHLSEQLTVAAERGDDFGAVIFRVTASRGTQRAAWLLSIAISVPLQVFAETFSTLWPNEERASAIDDLLRRPFVRNSEGYLSMNEFRAAGLSRSFRELEPSNFALAHRLFAEYEASVESETGSFEEWYTRGRIAFYLAGSDTGRSAREFRAAFVAAPVLDRTATRIWLSGLALRQHDLLSEGHTRDLDFYRGFRLYVRGRRDEARQYFERVLADPAQDVIRAIALHLAAVPPGDFELRKVRLVESMALNRRLGLREFEAMAGQTLTWALVSEARAGRAPIEAALEVARENATAAAEVGDSSIIARCEGAVIAIEWAIRTRFGAREASAHDAEAVLGRLRPLAALALSAGDLEHFVTLSNQMAMALRDAAKYADALDEVEAALGQLAWLRTPPHAFRRLAQTTGSIRDSAAPRDLRERARRLLLRFTDSHRPSETPHVDDQYT